MGLAYTLSKAEGMQGWDSVTEELYGKQGLRDRYYGPPSVSADHRIAVTSWWSTTATHFRTWGATSPSSSTLLHGWEASGVTQFQTGNPLDPICGTNRAASRIPTRR